MAPPKDIARSYPKRGLTADVGFRSEPKFCGDGSTNFNGSSDFATATNYAGGNAGGTFCFWFKTEAKATNQVIFSNANVTPKDAKAQVWIISSTIKFSDTVDAIEIPSGDFDANQWHFGCMVLNSTDGIERAYFDGVEHSTTISFGSGATTTSLAIGSRSHTGSTYFKGNLAKFKIFNVALTKDQVLELYNNPGLDVPTGLTSSNLRRNYELETDFNDSGADSENATASGSPSFTVDRPQLPRGLDLTQKSAQARVYSGRAVDFDGGADGLASTATLNINTSGAKATLACWVNPDVSTAGNKTIVSNAIDTTNNQFTIYQNGTSYAVSAVYASGFTKVNYFADSQVKVGAWTFLCAVWDFDTTSLTFYVDGASFTDTPSTAIGSTNGVFEIGCRDPSGSKSQLFDGQIASIKLFDTTLTQAQVRELYHNPEQVLPTGVSASNLKRYYPLSDYNDTGGTGGRYFQDMGADGEPAEDLGSSSMAFAQPVPCPQLGLQQSATRLYFENNASVASATLGAAPGSACTMSAWVFVEDNNFYQYIFTLGTTHAAQAWFGLAKYNTTGKLYALQNSALGALSSLEMNLNEWNHLVIMTKSTAPYVRMFFNGVEDTSIVDSGMVAYNLTNANVYMGGNPLASAPSQGFSNDCAIWDVELSAPEVAALYNSGVQGMDVSTVQPSNLKGWWKCDDLTTLKDYSGNGANATVSGTFAAASFPENASGSTIVGDFSMKRKGVSILNHSGADDATAIIPAQEAVYPKAGAANGYTIGFCYRKIKDGTAMVWGNVGASTNDQFMCFQQAGPNLRFNLGDGSSRPAVNTSNITDSNWHHYTLTISYATTPAAVKIYVDGAVNHSSTQSITGPPALHPMHLGTGLFDGQGPVGCFKFYQVALSADEVKRLAFSDLRLIKGLANE